MNTKLINKLKVIEVEIESCMDAIEMVFSISEETKLSDRLDKLQRERSKILRKIEKKSIQSEKK